MEENNKENREKSTSLHNDKLQINGCDILPKSQRSICDRSNSWINIFMSDIGCKDFSECFNSKYTLKPNENQKFLSYIKPKNGMQFNIQNKDSLSLYKPLSWVDHAKFPFVFIILFMALKLGRMLGEFLFLPYE